MAVSCTQLLMCIPEGWVWWWPAHSAELSPGPPHLQESHHKCSQEHSTKEISHANSGIFLLVLCAEIPCEIPFILGSLSLLGYVIQKVTGCLYHLQSFNLQLAIISSITSPFSTAVKTTRIHEATSHTVVRLYVLPQSHKLQPSHDQEGSGPGHTATDQFSPKSVMVQ